MEFKRGTYGYSATQDLKRAGKRLKNGEYLRCGILAHSCLEQIGKHYNQIMGTGTQHISDIKTHKLNRIFSGIDLSGIPKSMKTIYGLTEYYLDHSYPSIDFHEMTDHAAKEYLATATQIYEYVCTLIAEDAKDDFGFTSQF